MYSIADKEIQDMNNGEWEIYCPKMVITKNDGSEIWKGTGNIKWNRDRKLSYSLYTPCKNPVSSCFLFTALNSKSNNDGKFLMEESEFYTLNATDLRNRSWKSENVSDLKFSTYSDPLLIVSGDLHKIEFYKKITDVCIINQKKLKNICFVCYEFNEHQFPVTTEINTVTKIAGNFKSCNRNLDVAVFSAGGFDFEISKTDCGLRFEAFSEKPKNLPKFLLSNIRESFQFVLGRPIEWDVVTYNCNIYEFMRVVSWKNKTRNTRTPPPIKHSYLPNENLAIWQLFDCYLTYVQKHCANVEHSRMTVRLWNILQGSSSSWSVEKLTLVVEIEGLVQDSFKNTITPSLPMQSTADMVSKCIKNHRQEELSDADEKALNNILAILGTLKSCSSALNILRHLSKQGIVRNEDVKAWSEMRPKAAHGGGINFVDNECQLCSQLYVLFYHLIFSLIGYSGSYTDYGQAHMPNMDYECIKI